MSSGQQRHKPEQKAIGVRAHTSGGIAPSDMPPPISSQRDPFRSPGQLGNTSPPAVAVQVRALPTLCVWEEGGGSGQGCAKQTRALTPEVTARVIVRIVAAFRQLDL